MMRSGLTRFLTGSRFMRNLYGVAKVAAFVLLGALVAMSRAEAVRTEVLSDQALSLVRVAASVSVWVTVTLCVVRGIPVLLDSRAYLESAEG